MALKTGSSHAISTLFLTLTAAIAVQYLKHVAFFDSVFALNAAIAQKLSFFIKLLIITEVPSEMIEYTLVAFLLSFVWGIAYHHSRYSE